MYAIFQRQVEVVDTLLQHGARVDFKDNVRNYIHTLITCMSCTSHTIGIAY